MPPSCASRSCGQASYLQAVHETGARLTHDVKNLLQSLNVLCSVAGQDDSPELQALMRRQLPAITQRLSATLDKLQRPGDGEAQQVPLREWWDALTRQYQAQDVEFSAAGLEPDMRGAEGAVRQRRRQPAAERHRQARRGLGRAHPRVAPVPQRARTARARQRPRSACRRRGQPSARAGLARAWGLASACTRPRATRKRAATP